MKLFETIPVYRGHGRVVAWALVSPEDYERVARIRWLLAGNYAMGRIGGTGVPMHRLIRGLENGDARRIHHVNEEPLDNRRQNLLICEGVMEHANMPHPRHRDTACPLRPWEDRWLLEVAARPENAEVAASMPVSVKDALAAILDATELAA